VGVTVRVGRGVLEAGVLEAGLLEAVSDIVREVSPKREQEKPIRQFAKRDTEVSNIGQKRNGQNSHSENSTFPLFPYNTTISANASAQRRDWILGGP
jgi:hypothetical protein